MKYKIWLFIILFCYIYPIYIKFFPIPTDRIIQMAGLLFLIFDTNYRKIFFRIKGLYIFIYLTILLLVFIFLVQNWNYNNLDLYFFKDQLDTILYIFPAFLIGFLLYKIDSDNILTLLLDYIVLIGLFQAIISFTFFFIPSTFEFYSSLLSENASQGLLKRLGQIEKRLMGAGSFFFNGVIKYSVPLFILVILPHLKNSFVYRNKYLYISSLSLISVAGVMTGRTFFVAILMALLLFVLVDKRNSFKLIFKVLPITFGLGYAVFSITSFLLDSSRFEKVFGFVFELFINYQESGDLNSRSTEGTLSMYVFPTTLKTWLIGDGRMLLDNGSYYMRSDVGYVRLIFYFGIILTVLYFIYQAVLFVVTTKILPNKVYTSFMLILFIWILILNFKGLANLNSHLILLLVAGGLQSQLKPVQN